MSPYRAKPKLKLNQKETNKKKKINDIPDIFQKQIMMLKLFFYFFNLNIIKIYVYIYL